MKNGKVKKSKKFDAKKFYKITLKVLVSVLVVLSLAIVPTLCISLSTVEDKLSKASKYKGILELWNIDSFEGGTAGKSAFLQNRSIAFEKQNKGLYIMVKNMTENECVLALEGGQRPAMFSFGAGVGSTIINYLSNINGDFSSIKSQFLSAGKSGSNQYAIAWCSGMYSLISTSQIIEKAGQNINAPLNSVVSLCGSKTTLKNGKERVTYSLALGSSGYVNPRAAYSLAYGNIAPGETVYSPDYLTKTPYNAYCDFVEGKANILLGTQRDIARIENRYSQGKIDGVIYQHLSKYTDLVQFVGISQTKDTDIYNSCINFIKFIISAESQQVLAKIGMFSPAGQQLYTSGEWQNAQNAFNQITNVLNAFTTKEQIEYNKSIS